MCVFDRNNLKCVVFFQIKGFSTEKIITVLPQLKLLTCLNFTLFNLTLVSKVTTTFRRVWVVKGDER